MPAAVQPAYRDESESTCGIELGEARLVHGVPIPDRARLRRIRQSDARKPTCEPSSPISVGRRSAMLVLIPTRSKRIVCGFIRCGRSFTGTPRTHNNCGPQTPTRTTYRSRCRRISRLLQHHPFARPRMHVYRNGAVRARENEGRGYGRSAGLSCPLGSQRGGKPYGGFAVYSSTTDGSSKLAEGAADRPPNPAMACPPWTKSATLREDCDNTAASSS